MSLLITVTARSKAWIAFARSKIRIAGSNLTLGMDGYLCAFILCVGSALWRADPPPKESYWLCIGLRYWKAAKVNKGCKAIDR
jgi:hypothetical protein